jgi:hypothetical protein
LRFVLDESCWLLDGVESAVCLDILEQQLDQLDFVLEKRQSVLYSEDLFSMPLREGRSFYELYAEDSPIRIPFETRERIAAIFARLTTWQELESEWPLTFDVSVAGGPLESSPTMAWAWTQAAGDPREAVACLVHPCGRSGGLSRVALSEVDRYLWFISCIDDFRSLFRWTIVHGTRSPKEMSEFCELAFDQLEFVLGSLEGIKSMSRPYVQIIHEVVSHLSVLSDHGKRIFLGSWARAPAEFGALGVNISDENGNTKSNAQAKSERIRVHLGTEYVFWWHSKIELHRDRIHLCPDKVKDGGSIVIGIFCQHLTT